MRTGVIWKYQDDIRTEVKLPDGTTGDITASKAEFHRLNEIHLVDAARKKGFTLEVWESGRGRILRRIFPAAPPPPKPEPGVHHRATHDVSDETFHYDKNKKKTQ